MGAFRNTQRSRDRRKLVVSPSTSDRSLQAFQRASHSVWSHGTARMPTEQPERQPHHHQYPTFQLRHRRHICPRSLFVAAILKRDRRSRRCRSGRRRSSRHRTSPRTWFVSYLPAWKACTKSPLLNAPLKSASPYQAYLARSLTQTRWSSWSMTLLPIRDKGSGAKSAVSANRRLV